MTGYPSFCFDTSEPPRAVTFSANAKYLVGHGNDSVQVWRVKDGKQLARMEASAIQCLAVSRNGEWVAAGTFWGEVVLWNANTYAKVFTLQQDSHDINGVDFSPDSTRLVSASSNRTATVWDIASSRQILSFKHDNVVIAAKYSPQGDRIATATRNSVRIYGTKDGTLLLEVKKRVTQECNGGLLWANGRLVVLSDHTITQIEVYNGSVVWEWQIDAAAVGCRLCTVLSRQGEVIACATSHTVNFWATKTNNLLHPFRYPQATITAAALSEDNQFLAVVGSDGVISIKPLSTMTEPDIQISDTALGHWKHDQLAGAERALTDATSVVYPNHNAFAIRALIRAQMRRWDSAIEDAEQSIRIYPSMTAYIAKSMAYIGKGEIRKAYRICDTAFEYCDSLHVSFLLLIKAIIMFMAGEHDDAISRVDDIITTSPFSSICYVAYMHFLLGNLLLERKNLKDAIQLFERARAQIRARTCQMLPMISLMTGWKLDHLGILIRRNLCEALCSAGRIVDAREVVLEAVNLFGEEVYDSKNTTKWVSDFTRRCLTAIGSNSGSALNLARNDRLTSFHSISGSTTPSPLLREWTKATLVINEQWAATLAASIDIMTPRLIVYRAICESLETMDRVLDAHECFLQVTNELTDQTTGDGEEVEWMTAFRQRCAAKLECLANIATDGQAYDDAIIYYSAVVSLNPEVPHAFMNRSKVYVAKGMWEDALHDANQVITLDPSFSWGHEKVLKEWARANLVNGLWKDALSAAHTFKVPKLRIYQTLCEGLETPNGLLDAIDCFHQMENELSDTISRGEQTEWILDFKCRCCGKLERLGDAALDGWQHDKAAEYYSAALSIHSAGTQRFYILRSKVGLANGLWEDALCDADNAIILDPLSPCGYESKRAVLHAAGRYDDAIQTFEMMLSKMEESSDPHIRERRDQYISPSSTQALIHRLVHRTLRRSPRVLINTVTGRLYEKAEQVSAFMSLPISKDLVSSMTTYLDRDRIKRQVQHFFRYVMFSHKWEDNEPSFQLVVRTAVYDLDSSQTHDKLQTFCRMVRDAGFIWAWSDTCCINKDDHFVLQEALVSMFKWYRGSAMTFVFLRGVFSLAKLGALMGSLWNTRAWTLQEYVAAKVVRFYTEDWTPYLNLDVFNHKESPEIISEMEDATGVSAEKLMSLRPGLSSIREKLRLASTRKTTLVEDAAYSLLGIFSVSGIPPIYGEGENALGRLLSHILAGSGDASILAWTGQSGGYNSCLPARISVFNRPASSHLPSHIEDREMEIIVTQLRTTSLDLDSALKLYDRLNELPAPWFAASRMKLPCIAFKLPSLAHPQTRSGHSHGHVYRADTTIFGMVEIKTRQVLSRQASLYLVHPWLDVLLDREDMQIGTLGEEDVAEPSSPDMDDDSDMSVDGFEDEFAGKPLRGTDDHDDHVSDDAIEQPEFDSYSPPFESPPLAAHTDAVPVDRETRAFRLIARLRQPFGALLLSVTLTRRRAVVYRRVAADTTVTVQLRENVPPSDLLDKIRILDVL